jgi:hypothetical protein
MKRIPYSIIFVCLLFSNYCLVAQQNDKAKTLFGNASSFSTENLVFLLHQPLEFQV